MGTLTISNSLNTLSGNVTVQGGTLAVAPPSSLGNSTNIAVTGGTLELQTQTALADNATLSVADGAKVSITAGLTETVQTLYLGGARKGTGTWGSSSSGAECVDDVHFTGAGKLYVSSGNSLVWDGGGTNTQITTPFNWDLDSRPVFDGSSYITFGTGGSSALVNTNISLVGLCLNRDADFTLANGGGTVTLGSGGLCAVAPNATPRTYTLASSVSLATNQTWGVTNNGAGVATLVVSGPITDGDSSFGITKTGNGALTLAGSNSYDGVTVVATGGVLRVANACALGSTNGATTVQNGGWLEVSGNVAVAAETLTINGDAAVGNAGTLRSTGGTNAWTGPVKQGATAARIRVLGGGMLTLAGGLSGSAAVYLTPDSNATLSVSGQPVKLGGASVYANGAGTVALGAAGNAWGTLEVAGLTLRTDVPNALPASSALSVGSAYSLDGTVDLNGNSQTVGQLKRGLTGAGNRVVTSASPATLTVNDSVGNTLGGVLSGALSLVKGGSAEVAVAGTNTYSGSTVVSNGTLTVNAGTRIGGSLDLRVESGTLKVLTAADGLADAAALRIADGGGARVYLGAGVVETVGSLYLGGSRKGKGTWSASSGSGAENIDTVHFSGTGVINVLTGTSTAWDGGGVNTFIDTANNWDCDKAPAFDGSAYLSFGLGGSVATVNTNVSFSGLCLNRDADFTLANGGGTVTLGSGGLCAVAPNATPRTYTLASSVSLATNQTWGVTNNGAGVATLVVSGPITDGDSSFGITKTGNGALTLAGSNSYDGVTVVATGGVLRVANACALGSTNGATTVQNGGWLEVSGNVAVAAETLTINGDAAVGNAGTLRSTGGTNAWTGPVKQGATAARIRVLGGGMLTLAGGLSGSAAVYLTPDSNATLSVSGQPVKLGGASVYANGAGTVALGAAGNAWGTLEVAGLTLRTDVPNALPASSALSVGSAYSLDGTVDLNGNSQTVGQLKRGLTGAGNRVVTSASPATLTVNDSVGNTLGGVLSGALSLVKGGSAEVAVAGTNTYSGSTVVSNGTLTVNAGTRIGGSLDLRVESGTLKVLTAADGLADAAALRIADGGGARVYLGAGVVETVGTLYLGGKQARRGSWSANVNSGATYIDSTHFSGTGVIVVSHGPESVISIR